MKGGFIDECQRCSRDDRNRMYLGRLGGPNKGAMIEIYRENLATVRSVLKMESRRGFAPNLNISNVANQQIRDAIEDE